MCELLAMSFSAPVRPQFLFKSLLDGSFANPDGWGIAYYPDGNVSAAVFKEPLSGSESKLAEFVAGYNGLRSKVFVGHIRRSTVGRVSFDNTQPFSRYYGGRNWIFAHNGTLARKNALKCRPFMSLGDTDSERAFCSVLAGMKASGIRPVTARGKYVGFSPNEILDIYIIMSGINLTGRGSFNCILTDGIHLFVYRDFKGRRPFCFVQRKYPFGSRSFRDGEMAVNLADNKKPEYTGFVFASFPLSDEKWQEVDPGQMLVLRDGELVGSVNFDRQVSGMRTVRVSRCTDQRNELDFDWIQGDRTQ
jgi:predicted glutamine amidotransferase